LSTNFCRTQIERYAKGIRQRNLGNDGLEAVAIPTLSSNLRNEIKGIVIDGLDKYKDSKCLYSSAESYLLECLGMTDFAADTEAHNIKTLKESFLQTGRLDAEYYLPRFDDYCQLMRRYFGGCEPLGNVCTVNDANYTPENGRRYKYVELANIGKSGEIAGCNVEYGENLPTRARRMIHENDVIVSSIEGSLESCALVTDDYDGALCSTGFYVLRSQRLNPETLLTLFKSLPIQQLLKKGCSGTILTAISRQELEQIPIPLIRQEVQQEIAKHIRRSFELRREASLLLEKAKLTVEQAIQFGGVNHNISTSCK